MFFEKRVELSAYAAGKAAAALVIVARYLQVQGEVAAVQALIAVAAELRAGNTVRVGKTLPNTPSFSEGLEPLVDLVEPVIKLGDALAARRE